MWSGRPVGTTRQLSTDCSWTFLGSLERLGLAPALGTDTETLSLAVPGGTLSSARWVQLWVSDVSYSSSKGRHKQQAKESSQHTRVPKLCLGLGRLDKMLVSMNAPLEGREGQEEPVRHQGKTVSLNWKRHRSWGSGRAAVGRARQGCGLPGSGPSVGTAPHSSPGEDVPATLPSKPVCECGRREEAPFETAGSALVSLTWF